MSIYYRETIGAEYLKHGAVINLVNFEVDKMRWRYAE